LSIVSETRTFDEIVSTSLDLYNSQLTDNVFSENPTTWALKQAGFYEPADGGIQIIEPLMYGDNETVQSYSGYDTLDLSPQEGITAIIYPWTQVAGSIVISGMQEFQNAGKGKLVDLISAKVMQLEQSMQAKFTSYIYGAGKYNASQTSKDPGGLLAFVSEATDSYDCGGIDTSAYTWWQNKVLDNEGTTLTWVDGTALATGPAKMAQTFHCASKKTGGAPNLIFGTQKGFEVYANYLRSKQHIDTMSDMDAVAAGFENLKFRGMTLFWDSAFRSATVTTEALNGTTVAFMFLNSKFLKMRYASAVNFKRTPWITPANQDARSCLVLWYGNTTCNKRCKHAIMVDANVTEIL
jgi:hypothetical protein